jgi:integrase
MASIERRRDGRAGWQVRWRNEEGKQRKKSFLRKVDADRFRAEVEHALATSAYVDPHAGKMSFREYAEKWRAAMPHRPNTELNTKSRLDKHLYPVIGHRPLSGVRVSEVQALVTGLDLAPGSVRPVYGTLRAIFAAAVRDRIIGRTPCDRIKLPELPRELITPMTVDEVQALIVVVPLRYRALVEVGAGTGLRQGELFGLWPDDFDLDAGQVTVDRQVQTIHKGGRTVEVCPLKNRSSYRTVPVGSWVVEAVKRHLKEYPAGGKQFIFRDGSGQPLCRQTFSDQVWRPARTAVGLTDVGMHDLRHFYASALIRAGLSVKAVSSRLGHSNAAMTLNVYSHLWPDDEDRSRQAIDTLFGGDVPHLRPAMAA